MMGGIELTRERKGLRNPKLAVWKPITQVTSGYVVKRSKVNATTAGRLMLSQIRMSSIAIFLKLTCFYYKALQGNRHSNAFIGAEAISRGKDSRTSVYVRRRKCFEYNK